MSQRKSLFDTITEMADDLDRTKTASLNIVKKADGPVPKDPGGYTGPSTHPTASAPNNCQVASEGARSAENEADVKADQGPPSVNNASDATSGTQAKVQLNIGVSQSSTGEEPSVEDDYKGIYTDPGSSHPARSDNNALDGEKYAKLSFSEAYSLQTDLANAMMADIVNGQSVQHKAAAVGGNVNSSDAGTPSKAITPKVQGPTSNESSPPGGAISDMITKAANALAGAGKKDLAAGYELAATMGLDKEAAHQLVADTVARVIYDASIDADLFGSWYRNDLAKQAADAEAATEGEDHDRSGDDSSGANHMDGGESGGSGGGGDAGGGGSDPSTKGDSSAVLSLLGEGGGDGSPEGMAGGGGGPGGDPTGGMGGAPGGAPGGDPGGGPSDEELLTQIISALNELGIPIDQLAQLQGGAGGGAPGGAPGGDPAGGGLPPGGGAPPPGGGMPPGGGLPPGGDAGGMPPGGGAPSDVGMKLAAFAKAFMQSGRFRFVTANDGTAARRLRDDMKMFLVEHLPR